MLFVFRPHTVSTLRLTLLIGSYFAICASFILPTFGIGTQYRFHTFLKICWLSINMNHFVVQGFAYFVRNIICIACEIFTGSKYSILDKTNLFSL